MKRLFFALWPDETTRQRCAELAKAMNRPGEKPVRAENLHVTLVFLGGVDTEAEAGIIIAASEITVPSLAITFDRLDFWRRPRILCLSGHSAEPDLIALVDRLNEISLALHLPVDDRLYTPHVTLVRKAKSSRTLQFEPILWQADAFCLVESCSGPDGVEYRVLKEWKSSNMST